MPRKKNGKKVPRVNNLTNFPRRRRLPDRVQASSELWLEMFLHNIDTILATRDMDSQINEELTITLAESLADRALSCFEIRWPNAEL